MDKMRTIGIHKRDQREVYVSSELNLKNDAVYLELGLNYTRRGEHDRARKIYENVLKMNPKEDRAYVELGWYCVMREEYDKARIMFEKALAINQKNAYAYTGLGWYYSEIGKAYEERGEYEEAELMFKNANQIYEKASILNWKKDDVGIELGWYYIRIGDDNKAREMFEKALTMNPINRIAYGALAQCYEKLGHVQLAKEYFKKANELRLKYYLPQTRHNYQRLKKLLMERRIELVCVQYPVRSVESLKRMFNDEENILFVDNEKLFKEAIEKNGYDKYFGDMFAGDFGHCTRRGNRLLAENVAEIIIKECFHQPEK